MVVSMIFQTLRRIPVAQFVRDTRGSMSIEMLIVIPLLLFLATGGLAFWNAFNSNSRTAKVAYAVTDIMSRHTAVDDVDMVFLFDMQNKMLPPNVSERTLRITSICFEDGDYKVLWSYGAAGIDATAPAALQNADIPLDIMPPMSPQDSIILVELSASWEPQFVNVGLRPMRWNNALVTRPRFVKYVPHATRNPTNICPSDVV